MPTTQAAKNMPHSQPTSSPIYSSNQRGPTHRPHTEAYEYDSMSNKVPPAGEYLRAPVCCSECEEFWKALILEIDEKHTSRVPAGKASLVMAKGASGSVLQIKSTKHVTKERRFFPGLGCMNSTVRGDAFPSVVGSKFHSCQPRASQISSNTTLIKSGYRCHEFPQKKFNITTMRSNHVAPAYSTPSYAEPFVNPPGLSSVSRQFELQGSMHRSAVGYNAYGAAQKHDVISTPRRHGHIPHTNRPRSAVYPEPPATSLSFTQTRSHQFSSTSSEASQAHVKGDRHHDHPDATLGVQDLKPIRTRIDGGRRPEEGFSHLSTPRRYVPIYNENFAGSQGLHCPSYADSSQLKPFPRPTSSLYEKANSRPQSQEFLSHPSTPRMYTPMSQTPQASALQENRVEDFLHYSYPPSTPQTPSSRGRWDTQNYREHHIGNSPSGKASHTLRQPNNIYGINIASPKHPSSQEDYLKSAPSGHQSSQTANPSPGHSNIHDIPSERKLSRTSTIESGYTSLSIPRSDCSASSSNSQDLDQDSPPPSPRSKLTRARAFVTKSHRPQDLPRNVDSDTSLDTTRPSGGLNLKLPLHGPNNLSRTSTSTSSLMEPIVLFTGHGCRSETDENSEDDDITVTNPNYFKHIIANPNYIKHIIKPQAPKPKEDSLPKDLKTA